MAPSKPMPESSDTGLGFQYTGNSPKTNQPTVIMYHKDIYVDLLVQMCRSSSPASTEESRLTRIEFTLTLHSLNPDPSSTPLLRIFSMLYVRLGRYDGITVYQGI